MTTIALFVGVALAVLVMLVCAHRGSPVVDGSLVERQAEPSSWSNAFPEADGHTVATILALICEQLELRIDDPYQLRPSDRLLDIYAASYSRAGDDVEIENLADELEHRFSVPTATTRMLLSASVGDIVEWCLSSATLSVSTETSSE